MNTGASHTGSISCEKENFPSKNVPNSNIKKAANLGGLKRFCRKDKNAALLERFSAFSDDELDDLAIYPTDKYSKPQEIVNAPPLKYNSDKNVQSQLLNLFKLNCSRKSNLAVTPTSSTNNIDANTEENTRISNSNNEQNNTNNDFYNPRTFLHTIEKNRLTSSGDVQNDCSLHQYTAKQSNIINVTSNSSTDSFLGKTPQALTASDRSNHLLSLFNQSINSQQISATSEHLSQVDTQLVDNNVEQQQFRGAPSSSLSGRKEYSPPVCETRAPFPVICRSTAPLLSVCGPNTSSAWDHRASSSECGPNAPVYKPTVPVYKPTAPVYKPTASSSIYGPHTPSSDCGPSASIRGPSASSSVYGSNHSSSVSGPTASVDPRANTSADLNPNNRAFARPLAASSTHQERSTVCLTAVRPSFPGPAGLLPNITHRIPDLTNDSEVLSSLRAATDTTRQEARIPAPTQSVGPLWQCMMQDLELDPADAASPLNRYNLQKSVLQCGAVCGGALRRVPLLAVQINTISVGHKQATLHLSDHSGEACGLLSASGCEEFLSDLSCGCVLLLRNTTVCRPSPTRAALLTITADNIAAVYAAGQRQMPPAAELSPGGHQSTRSNGEQTDRQSVEGRAIDASFSNARESNSSDRFDIKITSGLSIDERRMLRKQTGFDSILERNFVEENIDIRSDYAHSNNQFGNGQQLNYNQNNFDSASAADTNFSSNQSVNNSYIPTHPNVDRQTPRPHPYASPTTRNNVSTPKMNNQARFNGNSCSNHTVPTLHNPAHSSTSNAIAPRMRPPFTPVRDRPNATLGFSPIIANSPRCSVPSVATQSINIASHNQHSGVFNSSRGTSLNRHPNQPTSSIAFNKNNNDSRLNNVASTGSSNSPASAAGMLMPPPPKRFHFKNNNSTSSNNPVLNNNNTISAGRSLFSGSSAASAGQPTDLGSLADRHQLNNKHPSTRPTTGVGHHAQLQRPIATSVDSNYPVSAGAVPSSTEMQEIQQLMADFADGVMDDF